MTHHGRTDATQKAIVAALRAYGATVAITSGVGSGFPDLVVGYRGTNLLLEVKRGPGALLTPLQSKWFIAWRGRVHRVNSVKDALDVLRGGWGARPAGTPKASPFYK